jgi:hypothetical protein
MFNRKNSTFVVLALLVMASTTFGQAQEAKQKPANAEIREAWRKFMKRKALPKNGCFKVEYPNTAWQEVPCGAPSEHFNQRKAAAQNQVGNGADFVVQASGSNLISSAVGSFLALPGVTVVSPVSGPSFTQPTPQPDIFMLQQNTQSEFNAQSGFNPYPSSFSTPACSGAPNGAAGCFGWQQFLFSQTQGPAPGAGQQSVPGVPGTTPGVFIEYWLFNWGTPCPSLPSWAPAQGSPPTTFWQSDGAGDCVFNGPTTYVPPQTYLDIPDLEMTSSVTATQDQVTLATGSGMYTYVEPNVLSLSKVWTQVEFNIFGDCCSFETSFTSPTVVVVKNSIDDGSTLAPTCVANDGTTGETNNLTFVPSSGSVCCPYGGAEPAIEFMQVFDTAHTHGAWCTPTQLEGDPHITTANGAHYNFQGAGEFVSLRDSQGTQIQTRQKAVSTDFIGTDPYDDLTTCVSLNTAVAARVGEHRVTWEPNLNGAPDPSGLQLRIDGALTTLGPQGRELGNGGRVSPQAGGALEVDFPDGKTLLVTPEWWAAESEWYLNVDISHFGLDSGDSTSAGRGLAGAITSGNWLPVLPGGGSLGPMPASLPARYNTLYKKFADAWRVNDKDSLFDYAPGTSTASFTDKEWPPEKGPCVVRGSKPRPPATEAVAQRACRLVADKNRHADCVFDVMATGDPIFAKGYVATQRLLAYSTTTSLTADTDPTQIGEWATFTASVVANSSVAVGVPSGSVQFAVDGVNVGTPIPLNSKGGAIWTTSQIKAGTHRVTASYIPSAESVFLPSTSLDKLQTVKRCFCEADREYGDR